VRDTAIKQQKN